MGNMVEAMEGSGGGGGGAVSWKKRDMAVGRFHGGIRITRERKYGGGAISVGKEGENMEIEFKNGKENNKIN